jgi:uncharacterized protein YaaW (UPF0174 family)
MKKLFFTIAVVGLLSSCGNDAAIEENNETTDSLVTDISDELENIMAEDTATEETVVEPEMTEAIPENKVEKMVSASGMTFCDCVKKQDELSKIMEETEDDELLMKTMKEMDDLRKGDCSFLFQNTLSTQDQVEARERKIKACLSKK